jgi:hypothetical protein
MGFGKIVAAPEATVSLSFAYFCSSFVTIATKRMHAFAARIPTQARKPTQALSAEDFVANSFVSGGERHLSLFRRGLCPNPFAERTLQQRSVSKLMKTNNFSPESGGNLIVLRIG